MDRTPLFIGLTQPVTFMGLPMSYVVILILVVMGGFMATLSFVYFIISAAVGYGLLRGLASYDARIMDVILTIIQKTPIKMSQLKGRGVTYRA